MKTNKIKHALKNYRIEPSQEWFSNTHKKLTTIASVTESQETRNSNSVVFNFLRFNKMNSKFKLLLVIGTIVGTMGLTTGVAYASDEAVPGDVLYPVDKAVESVKRVLTRNTVRAAELEMDIMGERVREMNEVANRLNEDKTSTKAMTKAIGEVDAQRERVQSKMGELEQLRKNGEIDDETHYQVMNQLNQQLGENEASMTQTQTQLKKGNSDLEEMVEEVVEVQNKYMGEMGEQIKNFEDATGIQVKEKEQNSGEDSQIQNQNQTQNQGELNNSPDEETGNKVGR